MKKHLEVQENTEFYSGRVEVMESLCNPGMVLIQLWMKDKTNDARDSAGIRLTSVQARQMANYLNALADQLADENA